MDPHATQASRAWALAASQHGVVTRQQLLRLGFHPDAIKHRVAVGRLHRLFRGVYAVGRPQLGPDGIWMAAVLSCGDRAVLSHRSAAKLWGLVEHANLEVSVPMPRDPRPAGVTVHRRVSLPSNDTTRRRGIPVTTPICTLIDLATCVSDKVLEAAVNEADSLRLARLDVLRSALSRTARRPGTGRLRTLLDRRTFVLTASELERLFLPLVREAGLSTPQTGVWLNGFKVDFYWPELGLVVETDSLTYHRTPAQQNADRRRDQAHTAAGLTPLRFTHAQVWFEARYVVATLRAVADRLRAP